MLAGALKAEPPGLAGSERRTYAAEKPPPPLPPAPPEVMVAGIGDFSGCVRSIQRDQGLRRGLAWWDLAGVKVSAVFYAILIGFGSLES